MIDKNQKQEKVGGSRFDIQTGVRQKSIREAPRT
jgi:hypothetical protein